VAPIRDYPAVPYVVEDDVRSEPHWPVPSIDPVVLLLLEPLHQFPGSDARSDLQYRGFQVGGKAGTNAE
jgi:hypothetical protein